MDLDVICLGILVADVVAKPIECMPEKGKLILVDTMELHTGGCAANTGVGLARLGIKTGLMGKVGRDGFGGFIRTRMKEAGLDITGVVESNNINTSATMVMVSSDAERSFFHYLGANADFGLEDIDFKLIKGVRILHVAGFYLLPKLDGQPLASLFERARKEGITTSLDTCWDSQGRWYSLIEPVLPFTDIFVPSFEEAKMVTGLNKPKEVAAFFIEKGVKTVGLKMGQAGCLIKTCDEEYLIPAFKVDVVDATGAGDSFVSGFLAGMVKGWNLKDCGRMGNAAGACCVRDMGASAGIKSFEETVNLMKGAQSL